MGIDTESFVPEEAREPKDNRPWKDLTVEERRARVQAAKQNVDKTVRDLKHPPAPIIPESVEGAEPFEDQSGIDDDPWSKGHGNEASFLRKKDARDRAGKD